MICAGSARCSFDDRSSGHLALESLSPPGLVVHPFTVFELISAYANAYNPVRHLSAIEIVTLAPDHLVALVGGFIHSMVLRATQNDPDDAEKHQQTSHAPPSGTSPVPGGDAIATADSDATLCDLALDAAEAGSCGDLVDCALGASTQDTRCSSAVQPSSGKLLTSGDKAEQGLDALSTPDSQDYRPRRLQPAGRPWIRLIEAALPQVRLSASIYI